VAKWGLVIQGPAKSFGGARFREKIFDCESTVRKNIGNALGLVDSLVLSSWENESWSIPDTAIAKLANPLPDFDRANTRKQFLSTLRGLEQLEAEGCDFIIKIRTDQLLPRSVFREIRKVFDSDPCSNRVLLSDFVPGSLFYAGDFVFAGSARAIRSFVDSYLGFGPIDLHPSTGVDYVLKFLCANDPRYVEYINPFVPSIIQIADSRNQRLSKAWDSIRQERFSFLTRESFNSIVWRGQKITEVIPTAGFGFDKENVASTQYLRPKSSALGALSGIVDALRKERRVFVAAQGTTPSREIVRGLLSGEYKMETG